MKILPTADWHMGQLFHEYDRDYEHTCTGIKLNVAMDALYNLHNQGRKVDVISHVQEMTERIPVQIKVSKQNGGKSKVEITGV